MIVKKLPEIDKNLPILSCFTQKANLQYPFYRIVDEKGETGEIFDRFAVLNPVFGG
jgi:hypothetical protein